MNLLDRKIMCYLVFNKMELVDKKNSYTSYAPIRIESRNFILWKMVNLKRLAKKLLYIFLKLTQYQKLRQLHPSFFGGFVPDTAQMKRLTDNTKMILADIMLPGFMCQPH